MKFNIGDKVIIDDTKRGGDTHGIDPSILKKTEGTPWTIVGHYGGDALYYKASHPSSYTTFWLPEHWLEFATNHSKQKRNKRKKLSHFVGRGATEADYLVSHARAGRTDIVKRWWNRLKQLGLTEAARRALRRHYGVGYRDLIHIAESHPNNTKKKVSI